jgi:hypothetical protein
MENKLNINVSYFWKISLKNFKIIYLKLWEVLEELFNPNCDYFFIFFYFFYTVCMYDLSNCSTIREIRINQKLMRTTQHCKKMKRY